VHCLPTTLGIDYRILNGRVYIGGNGVTDPAEIARRTEEFKQRAFYYYENWERLYAQWKEKMLTLIRDAEKYRASRVTSGKPLRAPARHSCSPIVIYLSATLKPDKQSTSVPGKAQTGRRAGHPTVNRWLSTQIDPVKHTYGSGNARPENCGH